jgi:malonyl-CoA O-methyltransferase
MQAFGEVHSARPGLDPQALIRLRRRLSAAAHAPWLHEEVARRMSERIALVKQAPERVLDWSLEGCGSLGLLRRVCASAALVRVRASEAESPLSPLAVSGGWTGRLAAWLALRRVSELARSDVPAGAADLVWSNMSLHLESDPLPVMRAWRAALKPSGFVFFSSLGPGSLPQIHSIFSEQAWGPAHAPFIDMHDLGDMLIEAGFAEPVMDQEILTLTFHGPDALLAELRSLGSNCADRRFAGCRTSAWIRRLKEELEARAQADGRIALDFEVVYGHAFAGLDRGPAVAERTTIGLENMRLMLRKKSPR